MYGKMCAVILPPFKQKQEKLVKQILSYPVTALVKSFNQSASYYLPVTRQRIVDRTRSVSKLP